MRSDITQRILHQTSTETERRVREAGFKQVVEDILLNLEVDASYSYGVDDNDRLVAEQVCEDGLSESAISMVLKRYRLNYLLCSTSITMGIEEPSPKDVACYLTDECGHETALEIDPAYTGVAKVTFSIKLK